MRKLSVFDTITLDGYFTDNKGDMSWAHRNDAEWNEFGSGNASGNGMLLFGRVTYQMMASYWPSDAAMKAMPEVAAGMNRMSKAVFSRSLDAVSWKNTRLLKGEIGAETARLKQEDGPDIVILGSGSIVSQLAELKLIDEFQLVISPTALGAGRSLFEGVKDRLSFALKSSRAFKNGNVVLTYATI